MEGAEAKAYYGLAVNYRVLEALVERLLVKETLTGNEVHTPPHPAFRALFLLVPCQPLLCCGARHAAFSLTSILAPCALHF